jgi:glycine/D-amino acid oxidase-like deaminating enzyme
MTTDFETIIIGAGAMGSAAAYHLARDNRSVLLLE